MSNPLKVGFKLPPFSALRAEHIEPAVDEALAKNRLKIASVLKSNGRYTWANLVHPMELIDDELNRMWSPVSHMNSVINDEEWRAAYSNCLPKLSAYATEIGQNLELYQAYKSIKDSDDFSGLEKPQKKIIENALRDFELSGVALSDTNKQRYMDISQKLSTLTNQFQENLMDATNAWSRLIEDETLLAGMPASSLDLFKQAAQKKNQEGWMLTLEIPCYMAVMTYAENRDLRFEMYKAFATRASDQGPNAGRWDNAEVMAEILSLRHEEALLLGFANYAELSLATKMANKPSDVTGFLCELADKSMSMAKKDYLALQAFAKKSGQTENLAAWDTAYYAEKLRQQQYHFSQEEVKPYFPADRVLEGLFSLVERLYGIKISLIPEVDVWHNEVQFFEIVDASGERRGRFYIDLYARENKRGGAWMDECVTRFNTGDGLQTAVAYLTCNFTPPIGKDPALLTHGEVETLFHEFGHGLHHMMSKVDYLSVSGIHGVEWDAVELPSQFMENWCWQPEVIASISGHYKTGEVLPAALFEKMLAAKNFQSGMQMLRQIEFSLFDFRIHLEYDEQKGARIEDIIQQVRAEVSVVCTPEFNRFANSFAHIFAGGYAAGYYSYKWAEVLSSDAFSLFEEKGVFSPEAGQSFLYNVLEKGGSEDALELFKAFRGREPTIDALLRHSGIAA